MNRDSPIPILPPLGLCSSVGEAPRPQMAAWSTVLLASPVLSSLALPAMAIWEADPAAAGVLGRGGNYSKIANRGKLGKSGQGQSKHLMALQKWKHEWYSFLGPFYKQGQKALKQSKTNAVLGRLSPSTDGESEEAPDALDDGNDSSSSNTRKELPEPFSASLTSPSAIRRTKKRTRDKDEKASQDQKAAHYGQLMTVMKERRSWRNQLG